MKNRFIIGLTLAAFAVGLFCFLDGENPESATLLTRDSSEIDSSKPGDDATQSDTIVATAAASDNEMPVEPAIPESASAQPEVHPRPDVTAEHEKFLRGFNSKLTDDPSTEDFLRNRLWLELDPLNGPLARSLNLTPNETSELKRLVAENLIAAANGIDPAADQDVTAIEAGLEIALADGREEFNAKLVQLLGETRFETYQAYKEDPLPFNRIKFLKPNEPLPDEQTERVLGVIADERRTVNVAAAKVLTEDGVDPQSAPAPDRVQWRLQIRRLIDERVYDRLQIVLSPDRLATVAEFQERHLQMLDSGMNDAIDAR